MVQSRILILICTISALGCTKATPEFELLDQNSIPQPKFSGSTVKNITTSTDTATFAITGECDPKIQSLSALAVGLTTSFDSIDTLTVNPATVACSSAGTFAFELKSLSGIGYTAVLDTTYEVQLRSVTSAGTSNPSTIRILYESAMVPAGAPRLRLAGGGIHGYGENANRMGSASFQLEARMSTMQNPNINGAMSSANFSARFGTSAQ